MRPGPQDTRLGSYNNYANLEEDTAQGLQRLHSMFAVCGEPPRVRSARCRSLLSESCPHLTRHPAEVLMKLAMAPKQSECFRMSTRSHQAQIRRCAFNERLCQVCT